VHSPPADPQVTVGDVPVDGEVVRVDFGPEPVGAAEVGDAGLGAEAGTAEDEDLVGPGQDLSGGVDFGHQPLSSRI
jgi:hypothetical protein